MERCFHIMEDEKIINRTIEMFETVFPNENLYLVILKGEKRHVKPRKNIIFIDSVSEITDYLTLSLNYKYFVIHFLRVDVAKLLTNFHHPNYCWIEWGADLYNNLLEYKGFPMYEDNNLRKILLKKKSPIIPFAFIRKVVGSYKRKKIVSKFVKNVKYFMPDSTPDELPLLLNYYPEFSHLHYKEIFYYPIDEILGEKLLSQHCNGVNIIVNHSASSTGNHIGVFERLKVLNLNNRKVITPISYGQKTVIDYIERKGYEILGESFLPVKEFMPLEEYNQLLLSANVFIYGHWRQEAVGNILVALYIGGKVFLSSKSPMFTYYKRLGLHLWSLEELDDAGINSPIAQSLVEENRSIVLKQYSKKRLLNLIAEDFSI